MGLSDGSLDISHSELWQESGMLEIDSDDEESQGGEGDLPKVAEEEAEVVEDQQRGDQHHREREDERGRKESKSEIRDLKPGGVRSWLRRRGAPENRGQQSGGSDGRHSGP